MRHCIVIWPSEMDLLRLLEAANDFMLGGWARTLWATPEWHPQVVTFEWDSLPFLWRNHADEEWLRVRHTNAVLGTEARAPMPESRIDNFILRAVTGDGKVGHYVFESRT